LLRNNVMNVTEPNTIKQMILHAVAKLGGKHASLVREDATPHDGESWGAELCPARLDLHLPRSCSVPVYFSSFEHGRFSRRDRACFRTK
jgi:hypothetical protein